MQAAGGRHSQWAAYKLERLVEDTGRLGVEVHLCCMHAGGIQSHCLVEEFRKIEMHLCWTHAGRRWPAFTGAAGSVYGNSSRETGRTVQQHCGQGLPAAWADHPPCAVLWLTGGACFLLQNCPFCLSPTHFRLDWRVWGLRLRVGVPAGLSVRVQFPECSGGFRFAYQTNPGWGM